MVQGELSGEPNTAQEAWPLCFSGSRISGRWADHVTSSDQWSVSVSRGQHMVLQSVSCYGKWMAVDRQDTLPWVPRVVVQTSMQAQCAEMCPGLPKPGTGLTLSMSTFRGLLEV